MSQITDLYLRALEKKYEAQIAEAQANLSLYLSKNLAAIGEHSDLVDEQDKWITKLSDAQGKLDTLRNHINVMSELSTEYKIIKS